MSFNDSKILASLGDTEIDTSGAIFRSQIFTIGDLSLLIDSGKLNFVDGSPFRRWTKKYSIRAIEGLLMGLPPASIVIDGSSSSWYVIDGAESLRAYIRFCNNELRLERSVLFMKSDTEPCFSELPARFRQRFLNTEISASILTPDCSYSDRLWAYWSALSREVLTRSTLWDCLGCIDGKLVDGLNRLAVDMEVEDPHILWLVMVGLALSDKIDNPDLVFGNKTVDKFIARAPFDIFECITLQGIYNIGTLSEAVRRHISHLCSFASEVGHSRHSTRLLCLILGWCFAHPEYINRGFLQEIAEIVNTHRTTTDDTMQSYLTEVNRIITKARND